MLRGQRRRVHERVPGPGQRLAAREAVRRDARRVGEGPGDRPVRQAVRPEVDLVIVRYATMALDDLTDELKQRCGAPAKQYTSVALFDHGAKDKICLLAGGGTVDAVGGPAVRHVSSGTPSTRPSSKRFFTAKTCEK